MGKAAIILVLGIAITLSILTMGAQQKRNDAVANACTSYNVATARNLAHSAANVALTQLGSDPFWSGSIGQIGFSGGTYTATCSRVPASSNSMITASGAYEGTSYAVEVLVQTYPKYFKSAITAKPGVTTLGRLKVDGRDRDEHEDIIPGQGGLAILSTQTVTRGGNSKYGGTNEHGVDFAPSRDFDPSIVKEHAEFEGGFPDTPDGVFGLPEGTLKSIAMSGTAGSQYATNPDDIHIPLKGVTYVELPDGGTWNSPDFTYCYCGFDYNSFGILIVHNANGNARLKNMRGNFYGVIVADDVDKVHGRVTGNITVIGDQPRGNCIGNGRGEIRYSSYFILSAITSVLNPDMKVLSWWE